MVSHTRHIEIGSDNADTEDRHMGKAINDLPKYTSSLSSGR